jgi:hypothetical protein
MSKTFIDYKVLRAFDVDGFKSRAPFPWENLKGFLTREGFRALYDNFPPIEQFEYHSNIRRDHNQRPHNRHYLAYENSIYHKKADSGVVRNHQLPEAWQRFMDELESSDEYQGFARRALGVSAFTTRYAWHVGSQGSEVSPHLDAANKLGTHILYFNTSDEWKPEWGGATLVLGGRQTEAMNPDFADFETRTEARIVDNHSFLFKNTPTAWHGVSALTSPPGSYRRLFNIIFEAPAERRLLDRARTILRL